MHTRIGDNYYTNLSKLHSSPSTFAKCLQVTNRNTTHAVKCTHFHWLKLIQGRKNTLPTAENSFQYTVFRSSTNYLENNDNKTPLELVVDPVCPNGMSSPTIQHIWTLAWQCFHTCRVLSKHLSHRILKQIVHWYGPTDMMYHLWSIAHNVTRPLRICSFIYFYFSCHFWQLSQISGAFLMTKWYPAF